ncbi:hypothetical protein TWF718_005004 [Orbilia javanica]|uniref:Uncharacterized protein n=1 Tax=Orbilia javanica TaxID=47235 RepID=A0AAN8MW87_9PEZI
MRLFSSHGVSLAGFQGGLYMLYGIVILLTAMCIHGLVLNPPGPLNPNIANSNNQTSLILVSPARATPSETTSLAKPRNGPKEENFGEESTKTKSSPTTSSSREITLKTTTGSIQNRATSLPAAIFYEHQMLRVVCYPPKTALPIVDSFVRREYMIYPDGPQHPKYEADEHNDLRLVLEKLFRVERAINGNDIRPLLSIVREYQRLCRNCECSDDGKVTTGRFVQWNPIDEEDTRPCNKWYRPVQCEKLWGCYCFAKLVEPRIHRGVPLEGYMAAADAIPDIVRDHPENRAWDWRIPFGEFRGRLVRVGNPPIEIPTMAPPVETPVMDPPIETPVMDPPVETPVMDPPVDIPAVDPPSQPPVTPIEMEIDPEDVSLGEPMNNDHQSPGDSSRTNVAPEGEPPFYLSGPIEQDSFHFGMDYHDPGEGSSTGATRENRDPYFGFWPDDSQYDDYFPFKNKRDVLPQSENLDPGEKGDLAS